MGEASGRVRENAVVGERNGRRIAENPELVARLARLAREAGEDVAVVVKRHSGRDQFPAVARADKRSVLAAPSQRVPSVCLAGLGHEVKLIAPEAVKPFVKEGKKNDAADAAAIYAAASRPGVKFVPAKSLDQQGTLALHSARSLLVKQQTMLANALRGLATEFGLTAPRGIGRLDELGALVDADETFPERAWQVFARLLEHCRTTAEGIEAFEAGIVAHARQDDTARRLATIPGVGPITASLIAATVGDIGAFTRARHFAAWLGLVPRQRSTGGKTRLGRITRAGNREIRRSLVLGATSMVYRAEHWDSAAGAWT